MTSQTTEQDGYTDQTSTEGADGLEDAVAPASTGGGSGAAVLNEKVDIYVDKRLRHLDRGPIQAYAAQLRGDTHMLHFALVCEKAYMPRMGERGKYGALVNPSLAKLTMSGVVYWPPAKAERFVLIYENNLGKPLIAAGVKEGLGWKSEKVTQAFIKPMLSVLYDLRDKGISHRGINPSNVFDGGAGKDVERVILGDCLSLPPGFSQPAMYESVERSIADPIARGEGGVEDDLYAMGVTITVLMRNNNPLASMSDEQILATKIDTGSFATLTSGERFSAPIMELLRGLLYDNPDQRLSLEEIEQWLEGQRLTPRQPAWAKKASRPLSFNGRNYLRPLMLAQVLEDNPKEVTQCVENGDFLLWISRSLEDSTMEKRFEDALSMANAQGRGAGYWDRVMSYIAMVMYPQSPVRYKGLKFCADGFSFAMANAFVNKADPQPFRDIIFYQFLSKWFDIQKDSVTDLTHILKRVGDAKKAVNQNNMGYGLERALYVVSPDVPCLSEALDSYYITNPETLMYALENISKQPDRPELIIDRHIAAFLSVRDPKSIDSFLVELNSRDYFKRILANLRILSTIQRRAGLGEFPGLTTWLADIMGPVYDRYHDRSMREKVQKSVEKVKGGGDLGLLAKAIDDDAVWKSDLGEFKRAIEEYKRLKKEALSVQDKLKNPDRFGKEDGQEIAAVVSGVISGIIILAFAFIFMLK